MEHGGGIAETVGAIVGLLLLAAGIRAISKRTGIPFTVALVVVGIGVVELAERGPDFLHPLAEFEIGPGLAFFVFLPTLIFESAYQLDIRQVRENLAQILTLAIPGLLLSTGMIGGIVGAFTPVDWPAAFLLGAILSATDPVAVISLFKQLGAPKRLTVLVEGESLFNDAAALVASRIILGVALAGYLSADVIVGGIVDFFIVFFGGILVGWLIALAIGAVIGTVEDDYFIEVSLTTILAYFSFLIAEEAFHVSGVMATVAAGVTMGGWGRTKISPSVAEYLEEFWEYMAFMANALVFLMVGIGVELGALAGSWQLLAWVVGAMLVSRAVVIYGLVPLVEKLPKAEPVSRAYRTVMYWGGLRGAVALAIVLSLPAEFVWKETFVALVTGAVLFTLLAQGLTIERLVRWLGLDEPPLADRLARVEGLLSAKRRAIERIPELQEGGLFSGRIADRLRKKVSEGIQEMRDELDDLRETEMDDELERRLLFLRCFATEKSLYYEQFGRGHVSERAYRDLAHSISLQTEAIRHGNRIPEYTLHPPGEERLENVLFRFLEAVVGFTGIAERLRISRTARDYEEAWGRAQGSAEVLEKLDELGDVESARPEVREQIRAYYRYWQENARNRLDETAEQFPEFVSAMQERLGERLVVHAEREAIEEQAHAGTIPGGVAEGMLDELAEEIRSLRASAVGKLRVSPEELLRKVPFFRDVDPDEFQRITRRLKPRTSPAGEAIIRQGEEGDSLYLIARGVIRVSREDAGERRDLATLMAGDFFGEMALLHREPRTATCRAVTPCALYVLQREDLDAVTDACPGVREALEEADRARKAEIRGDEPG